MSVCSRAEQWGFFSSVKLINYFLDGRCMQQKKLILGHRGLKCVGCKNKPGHSSGRGPVSLGVIDKARRLVRLGHDAIVLRGSDEGGWSNALLRCRLRWSFAIDSDDILHASTRMPSRRQRKARAAAAALTFLCRLLGILVFAQIDRRCL